MNNTYMKFQNDVQSMANTIVMQQVCADKGIDYNQLMQTAQIAHLQGIRQQAQYKRDMQDIADYYNQGNNQGFFGKLKEAFSGSPSPAMPMPNQMMNPFLQPVVETIAPTPIVPAPIAPVHDERVDKLEKEVAGIKEDVGEIKALLGQLASSMAPNIPLK